MKDEVYTQCKLVRDNVTQVAFIPSVFAKVDCKVRFKDDQGEWETDRWTVTEVYQTLSKASVLTQERAHVRHRKTTDI